MMKTTKTELEAALVVLLCGNDDVRRTIRENDPMAYRQAIAALQRSGFVTSHGDIEQTIAAIERQATVTSG